MKKKKPVSRGVSLKLKNLRVNCANPPSEPGKYYWSEWDSVVEVYQIGKGATLWVKPPGDFTIPVKVTKRIAGTFAAVQ